MKTLKDILNDLDALDAILKNIRDRLFWYDYEGAEFGAQEAYKGAGYVAASLELLADKLTTTTDELVTAKAG